MATAVAVLATLSVAALFIAALSYFICKTCSKLASRRSREASEHRRVAALESGRLPQGVVAGSAAISFAVEESQMLEALGASVERVRPVSITHKDHYVNIASRRAQQKNEQASKRLDHVFVSLCLKRLDQLGKTYPPTSTSSEKVQKLKEELRFLRTYCIYMQMSNCKNVAFEKDEEDVSEALLPLCEDQIVIREVECQTILDVIKKFLFKIRKSYALLSKQSWQLRPPAGPVIFVVFIDSVLENLNDPVEWKHPIVSVKKSLQSLKEKLREKLRFIRNFVKLTSERCPAHQKMGSLLQHAQVAATSAASLSYFRWVYKEDGVTESGMEKELRILLQQINPSTPELMEMYVELLKASKPIGSDSVTREQVLSFVNFLIGDPEGYVKDQTAEVQDGLTDLILFLMYLPNDCTSDQKRISKDIQMLAQGAAAADILVGEMSYVYSRFLKKMTLMKAETELLKLDSSVIFAKDKFTALHEGLKFLRTFVDVFNNDTEDRRMFLVQVERVVNEVINLVNEVIYLVRLIHENKMEEEMALKVNLPLILVLEKIKLIKSEFFLMKLQSHKTNCNWMLARKDQMGILLKGLRFLRTFLMNSTDIEDRTEDGKLFLAYLEETTSESSSLISLVCPGEMTEEMVNEFGCGEMTEEMVNEFAIQLFRLLEKIKLLQAEVVLAELLSHTNRVFGMKDYMPTLQDELRFLKDFLRNPPEEHNQDLKRIIEKSQALVIEAASLICSVYDEVMIHKKTTEIDLPASEVLQKITDLKAEIREMYLHVPSKLHSQQPRTDVLGFISSLLGNLTMLLNCKDSSIASRNHQFEMLYQKLEFLKPYLVHIVKLHNEHEELKDLWRRVIDIAYEAENVVDSFAVRDHPLWYRTLWITAVIEEIDAIKIKASRAYEESQFDIGDRSINHTSSYMSPKTSSPLIDEAVVGFSDEAKKIIDQLTRGSKEMNVISIVGMPGLGKTTLAKKVYNDSSVASHFHIRAWCCISQVYQVRELLLDILGQITELNDRIHKMRDEDIAETLFRCLKGYRYLIVMDDLWEIKPWQDLRLSFPDDNKGSRVLFTTRLSRVALQAKHASDPHHLRLLSDDESFELLQLKLFPKEDFREAFMAVGKVIAKNCKGLPLSVVLIAGLLGRTEKKLVWWEQVSQSVSSHVAADPQKKCMHLLELSYKHLPDHLKSCFLYFGAFPEDKEIRISKLLRLWIAEGFVQSADSKKLEDAAEEYLLDLIARSLVIVSKRRSNGGVKACQVHDLLRDLCIQKATEENFLKLIHGYDNLTIPADGSDSSVASGSSCPANPLTCKQRRLSIFAERKHFTMLKPRGPFVRSLLFFASNNEDSIWAFDVSFISQNFKLIRVLNLESINMGDSFPRGLALMVQLRYLALRGNVKSIPPSVSCLWKLETFLLKGLRGEMLLPDSFWNMCRLRHVHIDDRVAFSSKGHQLEHFPPLDNVDTLSTPVLRYGEDSEKTMRRFPRLRKLKCIFLESWGKFRKFPVMDFLVHLESLEVLFHGKASYLCEFSFPMNIKELSLSKFRLPWSEISAIGKLPNLQVLKLLFKSFEGKIWDMADGEFLNLKYLKLEKLDIGGWNASSDHFPCLEQLVVQRCSELEEIPSCLEEVPTMKMIDVQWGKQSMRSSARRIVEGQFEIGNVEMKFYIYPPDREASSSS